MKKPPTRPVPERNDARRKRWLAENPPRTEVTRCQNLRYVCYGKHKSNPYLYGVDPYRGHDSDRTLCDAHAGFYKEDFFRIPILIRRAACAGLIGNLIWTIDDTGWIFELVESNSTQNIWHGYPLLPSDAFSKEVFDRFSDWANRLGNQADRQAVKSCALLYGLKP